jgi:N-methylhydantoinase B
VVETAGGGGFGDPKSRPRDAIAADLANHKISAAAARDTYGYP